MKWQLKRKLSVMMSAALVFSSLNISPVYGAREDNRVKTIIGFEELEEKYARQELPVGAAEEDIKFPKSLWAEVVIEKADSEETDFRSSSISEPMPDEEAGNPDTEYGKEGITEREEPDADIFEEENGPELQESEVTPEEAPEMEKPGDDSQPDAGETVGEPADEPAEDKPEDTPEDTVEGQMVENKPEKEPLPAEEPEDAKPEDEDSHQPVEEAQTATPSQATDPKDTDEDEPDLKTVRKKIRDIEWELNFTESIGVEFDSQGTGIWIYEPVIPDEYGMDPDVELPRITVIIADGKGKDTALVLSEEAGGYMITVTADAGVFPGGVSLSVETVEDEDIIREFADAAKETEGSETGEMLVFDIKVLDEEGNEVQPDADKGMVKVSFEKKTAQGGSGEEDVPRQIYHMEEEEVKSLDTQISNGVAKAGTEHFSYFGVKQPRNGIKETIDINLESDLETVADKYSVIDGTIILIKEKGHYVISGETESYSIHVNAACTLELNNVNIKNSNNNISLLADTELILSGDNTLDATMMSIYKNIVIRGEGSLTAQSIVTGGDITIYSGDITALLGAKNITIESGNVVAIADQTAAITAKSIIVNGGTVLASWKIGGAMSVAPDISGYEGARIIASTNAMGSSPVETYNADDIDKYKYLLIKQVRNSLLDLDTGMLMISGATAIDNYYTTEGWKWDGSVLTLKAVGSGTDIPVKRIVINPKCTIKLESDIKLEMDFGQIPEEDKRPIIISMDELMIDTGEYTLSVESKGTDWSAIYTLNNLVIDGGVVHVETDGAAAIFGSMLTITGGARVTASGLLAGIASSGGDLTINDSSIVTALSEASAGYALLVSGGESGDIYIDNATVTAISTGGPAVNKAPVFSRLGFVIASVNADGTAPETYDETKFASYQYLRTNSYLGNALNPITGELRIENEIPAVDRYDTEGWKWEDYVLTLKAVGSGTDIPVKRISIMPKATIKLESDIKLGMDFALSAGVAIIVCSSELTIETGEYTLSVESKNSKWPALYVRSLVIDGGVVDAETDNASAIVVTALEKSDGLTITGGASVTASGGQGAISFGGDIIIDDGSTVTALSVSPDGYTLWAFGKGDIYIDNATVTAINTGGQAVNKAPSLTNISSAIASVNADGSEPETYDETKLASYQYLQIKPVPVNTLDLATGMLQIGDGTPVVERYNAEGWKWDGSVLTLKAVNNGTEVPVKTISIVPKATIKLESDIKLGMDFEQNPDEPDRFIIVSTDELTIETGEYTLSLASKGSAYSALYAYKSLVIDGGVVQVETAAGAITANNILKITGGARVTASGAAIGIVALEADLIINDGSVVTALSTSPDGYALYGAVEDGLPFSADFSDRNSGNIYIDNATVTAINIGGQAVSKAPVLTNISSAIASVNADGSEPETYDEAKFASYQYLEFKPAGGVPAPDKYTITVTNGTAFPTRAAEGETVVITANVPAAGQRFKEWTTSDGVIITNAASASATFTMPNRAVTVTAVYENLPPDEYSITVQNDGNGSANANVKSAGKDAAITLTAAPSDGYKFKEWQVVAGGVTIVNNQFTMPAGNVVVKAIFEKIPAAGTHTITALADIGGSITPAGSVTVNDGGSQTFTIAAGSNYKIKRVVVDGEDKGAISSYTFNGVTADHTISAEFTYVGGNGGSSSDNSSSGSSGSISSSTQGTTTVDPKKGTVNSVTGIITGSGSGRSNWEQGTAPDGSAAWKLQYADGTYAAGTMVTAEDGTTHEQPAWEMINGAWYPFGADGYVKSGMVLDPALGGYFYIDINTGMKTGWQLIDGKWYYFNPVSDGKRGIMFADTWVDGWYVDKNGIWNGEEKQE